MFLRTIALDDKTNVRCWDSAAYKLFNNIVPPPRSPPPLTLSRQTDSNVAGATLALIYPKAWYFDPNKIKMRIVPRLTNAN